MPKPQLIRLEDRTVPATLSGLAFADSDLDGVQSEGELGVAGVLVTLDPVSAGTFADQVTTDATGRYTFEGVAAGARLLRFEPLAGTTLVEGSQPLVAVAVTEGDPAPGPNLALTTAAELSTNQPPVTETPVTPVPPGETPVVPAPVGETPAVPVAETPGTGTPVVPVEAAPVPVTPVTDPLAPVTPVTPVVLPPVTAPAGSKLAGVVFADLNGNATRDAGEAGVGGVPVSIDLRGDGTVDYAVTTAADGTFAVAGVPDANAFVTVAPPVGFRRTQSDSLIVPVAAATPGAPTLVGVIPASGIGGRVTSALGGVGLAGVVVSSIDALSGVPVASATTDAEGNYLFANVAPGRQTLSVAAPPGAIVVTADGSGLARPEVGQTGSAALVGGQDFAIQYAGSVTGKLGVPTGGLGDVPGVAPAAVAVLLGGVGEPVGVTPTTLADGSFRVDGVPDGVHTLVITPPTGTTTSAPTRVQFEVVGGNATTVAFIPLLNTGSGSGNGGAPGAGGSKQVLVGSGAGGGVRAYGFTPNADGTLTPVAGDPVMTPAGSGGVRVVLADFDGDGTDDTITGTGPGESVVIRVLSGKDGSTLAEFAGFEAQFTGGVNLAAADFNRDGKADIVVAADAGGGPRVRVFNSSQFQPGADTAQGKVLADFFAIEDARFRGGARVAAGDITGDGFADLVVSAGAGGGPRVAVYDGRSVMMGQAPIKVGPDFFAFEPQLRNGVSVSVGDVNGDGFMDLVTGAGPGGAPRVVVFSGMDLARGRGAMSGRVADFYVNGDSASRRGTVVTARDLDGDNKADLVATSGPTAFVVTSKSIVSQFLTPRPGGPRSDAAIDAFPDGSGVNLG